MAHAALDTTIVVVCAKAVDQGLILGGGAILHSPIAGGYELYA
jgi:hypothetical protein